ncbi:MAG: cyclic nucleotide-binding domain-containing protein [Desulfobacterales bacterium]|nr:cyclic nucleotide-binding domain-containing protein [Desulfobacterales bacterium]
MSQTAIININKRLQLFWNFIILVVITYCAVEATLRLVIKSSPPNWVKELDSAIIIFFASDLIISFFFNVLREGKWVTHPYDIAMIYLKGWFTFDLIAAIPFDLILPYLFPSLNTPFYLGIMRLGLMAKIPKLWHYRRQFEHFLYINVSVLRLLFSLYLISLLAHWIACGWYFLTAKPELNSISNYINSIYWTMTTLATVGYGDITPANNIQKIYAIAIMILGAGVYGYVIGNIASIIGKIDISRAHHQELVEKINAFMLSHHFPQYIEQKVKNYFSYLWDNRGGYDISSIFAELPESFKVEFSLFLNKEIFEKIPLFKNADESLIREIAVYLKPCIALPDDIICRYGEIGDKMYFLNKGTVEVVAPNGDIYTTLGDGSFFGETALLMSTKRNATIRATDYCEMYSLDKKSFDRILKNHYEFAKEI